MGFLINNFVRQTESYNSGEVTLADSSVVGGPAIFSYANLADLIATIAAANYFSGAAFDLSVNDYIFVTGSDASAMYQVSAVDRTVNPPTVSLVTFQAAAPVGTANILDGAVTGPKLNDAMALDAPIVFSQSTSSATPGTLRNLTGALTSTATTMTSGNLVGLRGEVDYVGASGGFVYGVQGKILPSGTLSGSSWNAGLFGQLDIHAATINAGQIAPIWGDYGATSGTLSDQTGCYGIAMTNTTAVVTQGQIYLYGGSQNLLLLETNAGLSGVTYFKASGTGSGSWGNATPPTPSKVLKISVDGTAYYIPLVAQNT